MKVIAINRPSESFRRILKVASILARATGCDVTDPNYRINWVTGVSMIAIAGYFIFTFATIIKLYDENPTFMLEALCMAGGVVQGTAKLISAIGYKDKFTKTRYILQDLYKEYEQKGSNYRAALNDCCTKVRKLLIVIGLCYFLAAMAMITLPLALRAITGQRHMIMHFHIPGVDVNTTFGDCITFCAHLLCMFIGSFGLYTGDIYVLIYLTQAFLFVDIFKIKIEELNEMVENIENNKSASTTKCLVDIVKWHQFYMNYTKNCNNYLYYIVTVQIISNSVACLLTLYALVIAAWPGAFPFLVVIVYSLYVYCILGSKIETCNDEFCSSIYNISWYNLTLSQQKIVRLMLMKSQSPHTIMVAGVMPLSVSTALQITKTMYSIFMMMLQML